MAPNPYLKALAPGASTASPSSKGEKSGSKGKKSPADQASGSSAPSPAKGKGKATDETLKAEILALGGDEDDLKLLEDVDSESEVEEGGDGGAQAGLLGDLKSFMKGLDFKAAGAEAPASDDDEGEAAAQEDDEEVEDEPMAVEEEAPAPVAPVEEKKKDKKESKHEREERRKAEREAAKAEEDERKEEEREAREEKRKAKLLPTVKSPWVVDPTPHWYAVPVPAPSPSAGKPNPMLVSHLLTRGQTLLDKENQLYSSSLDPKAQKGSAPPPPTGLSKADQLFIQQILTSGTSSDKISALLLLVSSSPLHNTTYLDQLAALCRKKSRDESGRALRGVVDWWRSEGGGSPDRKLRYFADQPALATIAAAHEQLGKSGKADLTREDVDRCLVLFAFEDWFKRWFFQILQALEQMSVDPLPHPRTQAVMHLSNLLRDKPEQESNILRLLVNKLGDTQRGIASKTSHHLLQVLQTHPGMTGILVREVSALILQPRTSAPAAAAGGASTSHVRFGGESDDEGASKKKAAAAAAPARDHARDNSRYYGVTTLNQVMLKKEQGEVAGRMVDVYFEVFGDVLGRLPDKEDSDDEAGEADEGEKKVAGKKRGRDEGKAKKGKKGKGKGAAQAEQDAVNDVDSKLVAAVLTGINRAFPFAKLDDEAFKRRLDTLFRITHTSTFNVSIQALMLIFHVSSAKRDMSDRFYRALYTSLHDPRLVSSSKQALYLNLFFRATKQDKDANRVAAFVKRLLQILFGMETTFVLGALYIVGELLATVSGLRTLLNIPEKTKQEAAAAAALEAKAAGKDEGPADASTSYDGRKREPRFANALNSCLWELNPLLHHYHPTVALYASQILAGEALTSASDLEQFSLAHFLDRFVYREAKKSVGARGASMMQSGLAGQDKAGRVTMVKGGAAGEEALNSEKFRRRNVHEVPVDQVFFHKYFTSKSALSTDKSAAATKRKARRGGKDSDDDSGAESGSDASIGDVAERGDDSLDEDEMNAAMEAASDADEGEEEEFEMIEGEEGEKAEETDSEMEEEIWKAMKASLPREKGDSDLDLSLSGAEDADASDAEVSDEDEDDAAALAAALDADEDDDPEVRAALAVIERELAEARAEAGGEDEGADSDVQVDDMDELLALGGESDLGEDNMDDVEAFEGISSASASDEEDEEDDDAEPFKSAFPPTDDEDDDGVGSAEDDLLEDDADLFGSDEDVRLGGGSSDEEKEEEEEEERKRREKAKRRKVKHLPTFASAEDYAHLLGGSDDEEI
ncbi:hypothetical protein JCM10207_006979 [Rhodosporidiobolus poonsookiae]